MSLTFIGPAGTTEQRWIFYALLRDNLLHHVERELGSPDESALWQAGTALGLGSVMVSAKKLRDEVQRAEALLSLPIAQLAISNRTRSALTLLWPPENPGETELVTPALATSLPVPSSATKLGDVFGHVVEELLRVTKDASDDDKVEIRDT